MSMAKKRAKLFCGSPLVRVRVKIEKTAFVVGHWKGIWLDNIKSLFVVGLW